MSAQVCLGTFRLLANAPAVAAFHFSSGETVETVGNYMHIYAHRCIQILVRI